MKDQGTREIQGLGRCELVLGFVIADFCAPSLGLGKFSLSLSVSVSLSLCLSLCLCVCEFLAHLQLWELRTQCSTLMITGNLSLFFSVLAISYLPSSCLCGPASKHDAASLYPPERCQPGLQPGASHAESSQHWYPDYRTRWGGILYPRPASRAT